VSARLFAWGAWPWLLVAGCTEERLTVGVGAPHVLGAGRDGGRPGSTAGESNAATGPTAASSGGAPAGSGIPSGGLSGGGMFGGGRGGVIDNASGSSGAGGVSMTGSGAAGQDAGSTAGAGVGGVDCAGGVACSRSCSGMSGTECQGDDCCASPLVPGGTFERTTTLTFTATVSSFRLDKFEVTVARYRNFIAARDAWRAAGNPVAGAGEHPHIPGTGWDESWEQELPSFAFGPVDCSDPPRGTYVDVGQDTLPANCVSWVQAFEFCVWDGGRLPTDTEWEYAAVGGPLQYSYPWGNTPVPSGLPDGSAAYAVYDNLGDGSAATDSSFADIRPVGSRALGAGPFGQMDLAGSMAEWTLDDLPTDSAPVSMPPVTDWAAFDPRGGTAGIRGGDWASQPEELVVTLYRFSLRESRFPQFGFRCARGP
jgi:sulfatase modifying factor 1